MRIGELFYIVPLFAAGSIASSAYGDSVLTLRGGYVLEGGPSGHLHFSPNVVAGVGNSGSEAGAYGSLSFRYSWDDRFVEAGYQYIDVGTGRPYSAPSVPPELGIQAKVLDIAYGGAVGEPGSGAWSIGLRHANFDIEGDNFSNGSGPLHAFQGTGVRVGYENAGRFGDMRTGWFFSGGLSMLRGTIETSSRGGWICGDCVSEDTTNFVVDALIGLEHPVGAATLSVGYNAQYWGDVNVGISDDSGSGLNQGTSNVIIHGPFAGVNFRF